MDAVVTDPPYGIGYDPQQFKKWSGEQSSFQRIYGDDKPFDPAPFLDMASIVVMWGANNYADKLPIGGWVCWDKRTNEQADRMFGAPFELAWMKGKPRFYMARIQHGGVVNADSRNGNNEPRVHPTQKPVALMRWVLDKLNVPQGATVFDPFMGSGTTGVACVQTGRNFIGCEIDAGYFEIARKRIESAQMQPALEGIKQ